MKSNWYSSIYSSLSHINCQLRIQTTFHNPFYVLRNYTTLWARSVGGRNLGLVFTDGQFYWNQKHFAVKHLKNFGFGKTSLQTVIVDQANDLTNFLEKQSVVGYVEISNEVFATPVINVLWSMMAGDRKKISSSLFFSFSQSLFISER